MQLLSYFADTTLLQYLVIESEGVILYSEDSVVLEYKVICRRDEEPERYEEIKKGLTRQRQTCGRDDAL